MSMPNYHNSDGWVDLPELAAWWPDGYDMAAHGFDFKNNYREDLKALKVVMGGVHVEENLEQELLQDRRGKLGSSIQQHKKFIKLTFH